MFKTFDIMLVTTFSTIVAAVMTYVAHLIEAGHILNPNWHYAEYFLLIIAMFFIIVPYLIVGRASRPTTASILMGCTDQSYDDAMGHPFTHPEVNDDNTASWFKPEQEECHNEPVQPVDHVMNPVDHFDRPNHRAANHLSLIH